MVADDQERHMTYMRGEIERILSQYRGMFVCRRCLSRMIRDNRPPLYTPVMIEREIDEVIEAPGELECVRREGKCSVCMGGWDTTCLRSGR
jgi:hypothetical protein